jgi:beta-ring hydroxylase
VQVDTVLGDSKPSIAQMKSLVYTTRVINESMRLYPQPPVLIRRALEADKIGGYAIKPGQDVFISVWNLHRSPELWDEPESFRPERFGPLDGTVPNEVRWQSVSSWTCLSGSWRRS